MSEEATSATEMEVGMEINCNNSGKSALNFSISRLLSAGAEQRRKQQEKGRQSNGKNNNNNVVKTHKHTIHHRAGPHQEASEVSKHVTTRHGDDEEVQAESDCSDETDKHNNIAGDSDSDEIEMDDAEERGSKDKGRSDTPQSRGDSDNRSSPESQHGQSNYHHHLSQLQESHLASSASYNPSTMEGLTSMNPFPMLGYSSIFLPNFPCPLTSSPNHVIRVPAHRPMSNFQLFGQSGLGQHNPLDMNSSPLFSTFDPRSSLLLKDRLNGENRFQTIAYLAYIIDTYECMNHEHGGKLILGSNRIFSLFLWINSNQSIIY